MEYQVAVEQRLRNALLTLRRMSLIGIAERKLWRGAIRDVDMFFNLPS
jgi:hypothetical protein